jgi:hypothetical protein
MTILLLPFASLVSGDEVSAKLARQIPRMIGADIDRACVKHNLSSRYLSSRGTAPDGTPALVATTDLPTGGDMNAQGEMYQAELVITGRVGLSDTGILLEVHIYDVKQKEERFAKRFETFPSYFFDCVEEVKVRITQLCRVDLAEEERLELFRRATESWQAYLYYLLAEDERYGLTIGVIPKDALAPLVLYHEALTTDRTFERAALGLQHYIILLLESDYASALAISQATTDMQEYLGAELIETLRELT